MDSTPKRDWNWDRSNSTPPDAPFDRRCADLAFAVLNEYRVRTNFIPADHRRHFPGLVAELAEYLQETLDSYLDNLDSIRGAP